VDNWGTRRNYKKRGIEFPALSAYAAISPPTATRTPPSGRCHYRPAAGARSRGPTTLLVNQIMYLSPTGPVSMPERYRERYELLDAEAKAS